MVVIAVFMIVLFAGVGAIWFRHLWSPRLLTWVQDVAEPIVSPPRNRPVPALGRIILRRVKVALPVSVRGRTQIPQAVRVRVSPADRQKIAMVEEVLVDDLTQTLLQSAIEHDWMVIKPPRFEFVTDDRVTNGQPRIQILQVVTSGTTDPFDDEPGGGGTVPTGGLTLPRFGGRTQPQDGPAPAELVGVNGRTSIVLRATVRIGRLVEGPGRIAEPSVSAHHATLAEHEGRWILTDESSTNGTYVNGRKINTSTLIDGDEVEIGLDGPRFLFSVGGPPGSVRR